MLPWAVTLLQAAWAVAPVSNPAPLLSQIRSGIERTDGSLLAAAAPKDARVRVDVEQLPTLHGSFGARQLAAVFEQALAGIETLAFEFEDLPPVDRGTIFARARWRRRPRGRQQPYSDTLTFVLTWADQGWHLAEIRSSP